MIYLIVLQDRHSSVEVKAFHSMANAIAEFDRIVKEYDYRDDETPVIDLPKGWLKAASLSSEGDRVRLQKIDYSDRLDETFKRFMVFSFSDYYPSGGIGDCVSSHDTYDESKSVCQGENSYIFDRVEGKVVLITSW